MVAFSATKDHCALASTKLCCLVIETQGCEPWTSCPELLHVSGMVGVVPATSLLWVQWRRSWIIILYLECISVYFYCWLNSRGSVATCLRWDGSCCMGFVANFIRFPALQKFWKSVKIWQSYKELNGGNFFETQCRSPQPKWVRVTLRIFRVT